ncbi:hypothetical protein H6P81_006642 [Aristolochia fimbriata]|uniref:DUF7953 domain-containing protein n=1 Tax=Aristolochia fimbriata TaxID=158543 RepID=A0AAV7F2F3_ARIFI|nr:hypothetical protein H6P81_006642 [Aristolochia fimbriata]
MLRAKKRGFLCASSGQEAKDDPRPATSFCSWVDLRRANLPLVIVSCGRGGKSYEGSFLFGYSVLGSSLLDSFLPRSCLLQSSQIINVKGVVSMRKTLKSDDIFDEWELCPDEFLGPGGKYVHIKEKEFSATFSCPECVHQPGDHVGSHKSKENHPAKGVNLTLVILVIVIAAIVSFAGMLAAYRYWQRRRREQDQALFLKLFEEGDDIEDELSLGHVI